jgi:hypothetical protein
MSTLPFGAISTEPEPIDDEALSDALPDLAIIIEAMNGEDFYANLADQLDSKTKTELVDDIIEWVTSDRKARASKLESLIKGLESAGEIKKKDCEDELPFKTMSALIHPLLPSAVEQFASRAIMELMPPGGAAKGMVIGRKTDELQDRADRVASYENYSMTQLEEDFIDNFDSMLHKIGYTGSEFRKVYWDSRRNHVVSEPCQPGSIVVPYSATSLNKSERITHIITLSDNALKWKFKSGEYDDPGIQEPSESDEAEEIADFLEQIEEKEREFVHGDEEHVLYECHCNVDIPELGDTEDGLPVPYIITIHASQRKVLSVRRNWDPNDSSYNRLDWIAHYKLLPGFGPYGKSFIDTIGVLGEAASGIMNAIILAGAFASCQGGFKTKEGRNAPDLHITPGVYKPTDMSFDDIAKAFFTPDFKEPSGALFQTLEFIVEWANNYIAATNTLVSDSKNTGPVGTTLSLLEEAYRVYSAIHKRLHDALGRELKIRKRINAQNVPTEGYPFLVEGATQQIMADDYGDNIMTVPVSDPNIASSTQRISKAQALLQLSQSNPGMYDTYEANNEMLRAIGVNEPSKFLPDPNDIPHSDPISEGMYLMVGKPIRAHIDEDHQSHIIVHQSQMQMLQGLPNPQAALAALSAHMAEHTAFAYQLQWAQMMGATPPNIDLFSKKRDEVDVNVANQFALQAGIIVQQIQAQQAAMQQQAMMEAQAQGIDPSQAMAASDAMHGQQLQQQNASMEQQLAHRQAEAEQKAQIQAQTNAMKFQQQQEQKDASLQNDIARDQLKAAHNFLTQTGAVDLDPKDLLTTMKQTNLDMNHALALIRQAQMEGQGQGVAPEAMAATNPQDYL